MHDFVCAVSDARFCVCRQRRARSTPSTSLARYLDRDARRGDGRDGTPARARVRAGERTQRGVDARARDEIDGHFDG